MLLRILDSVLFIRGDAEVDDEDISFDLTEASATVFLDPLDKTCFKLLHDDKTILFRVCYIFDLLHVIYFIIFAVPGRISGSSEQVIVLRASRVHGS